MAGPTLKQLLVNPLEITNFQRDDRELELFWFFAIFVAGKQALTTARKVTLMFNKLGHGQLPRDYLRRMGSRNRHRLLVEHRIGQYDRIGGAITASLDIDLANATVASLEAVPGVGPKTSRFFVLHSQADSRCVPLDTHILSFLRDQGVTAPSSTPPKGKRYDQLESLAIKHLSQAYPDLSLAAADLLTWKEYSGNAL
jgi:hypothetical protein